MQKVAAELHALDPELDPIVEQFTGFAPDSGNAVVIRYKVPTGRYKGGVFGMAFSFQETAYPEYPPHFIHVAGLPSQGLTPHAVHQHGGMEWKVFSVPPNDFWDALPMAEKNMRTYMRRHVPRFWSQL